MKSGYLSEIFVSFQGEGARVGERHLFVRLAGCNLRCRYCDTPDSLERVGECTVYSTAGEQVLSNPLAPEELYGLICRRVRDDSPIDAIALTGGEPLVQAEFLRDLLGAGAMPVPVLLETNGMLPERLGLVIDRIDVVSMDIKPPSSAGEGEFWDEHAEFLRIAATKDLYVKVVVDQLTEAAEISRATALVAELAPRAMLFLQPMMDPRDGSCLIDGSKLTDLYLAGKRHHDRVLVLPQTHKILSIQ